MAITLPLDMTNHLALIKNERRHEYRRRLMAVEKSWRDAIAATGWRAWSWPRRGRRTGRLAFLDAVFHVAACAIDLLVEVTGLMLAASQRGDDKTRVGLAAGPLGLADDAARPAPAIQRRPGKVLEAPRRLAGLLAVLARGG